VKFPPINTCDGARWINGKPQEDASLSVRMTAHCDSACSFCIAQEDMKEKHPFNLETVIKNTLSSGSKAISLIGGEPLLFLERCRDFIVAIRPHVEEIYITTNLPITILKQWELFTEIMTMTDFLTVSIQSLDNEINRNLLNSKQDFNRVALLERVLKTEGLGNKVTVNLNLVKGGIDSRGKFLASYLMIQSWGCQKLRVNELMHAPQEYVNFEKMMGITLPSPYAGGCKTRLPIEGMEVYLKRSCFLVEDSLLATDEDAAKIEAKLTHPEDYQVEGWRVLYEHGEFDLKWRQSRKLLPLSVK
jgi:organic radical activating enzyme